MSDLINENREVSFDNKKYSIPISDLEYLIYGTQREFLRMPYRHWRLLIEIVKNEVPRNIVSKLIYQNDIRYDYDNFLYFINNFNYLTARLVSQTLARRFKEIFYITLRNYLIKIATDLGDNTKNYRVNSRSNLVASFLLLYLSSNVNAYNEVAVSLGELLELQYKNYDPELCLAVLKLMTNILYYHNSAVPYLEAARNYLQKISSTPLRSDLQIYPPISNELKYKLQYDIVKQFYSLLGYKI